MQAQLARYQRQESLIGGLRRAAPFKVAAVEIDETTRRAQLFAAASPYLDLAAFREMEANLRAIYRDWELQVVPPVSQLPSLYVALGSADLDEAGAATLETIRWSLER